MSSVGFIRYIFINGVQCMLTPSLLLSDVLYLSANYLHHLELNERDHLMEFVSATWLNPRRQNSALPEVFTAVT